MFHVDGVVGNSYPTDSATVEIKRHMTSAKVDLSRYITNPTYNITSFSYNPRTLDRHP